MISQSLQTSTRERQDAMTRQRTMTADNGQSALVPAEVCPPRADCPPPSPSDEKRDVLGPKRSWPGLLLGQWIVPLLVFWGATVGLQHWSGAYQHEYGGHADEASHFVTALMVHDYLVGGVWTQPMRYADNYYLHYPRVSLGHWPPFFYLVQTAWMLPLGTSRMSLMLLMALITALTSLTLYRYLRGEVGTLIASLMGLLYLAMPLVQRNDTLLMADTLTALLCLWAALCFGRFLETGSRRSAAGFGLLAVLAIMTKGSGLLLVLLPPLGLLLGRRLRLMGRAAFWLPALLVLVLCGPWYWLTRHMARNGLIYTAPTLEFTIPAVVEFSWTLMKAAGLALFVVAAVGFWQRLVRPALGEGARGKWAACGALLVAAWLFICVVPVSYERRYIIPMLPPFLLFLAAGLHSLGERLPLGRPARAVAVTVVAAAAFGLEAFALPDHASGGYDIVAERLLARPDFAQAKTLVSSDPHGDGMFIADIARREQRPGHLIYRASKKLGQSDWMGHGYQCFFHTPPELMAELDRLGVDVLVVDTSAPPARDMDHHKLLIDTIAAYPNCWQSLGSYDVVRPSTIYENPSEQHPAALRVYRRLRN
jgi:hypothetical protein